MEENLRKDFKTRMIEKSSDVKAERDLYKSQKVCEQLDSQKVQGIVLFHSIYYIVLNLI